MAGLASAWELKNAGHEVVILEAQLHPGGRVHTIREGLSTISMPKRAQDVSQYAQHHAEWVNHFGLQLEPFFPHELAQVALLKGKRVFLAREAG